MNNIFLSIILLLVMMFVVLTTLNRGKGAFFGNFSTFFLVIILILVVHFLIKNVLKTRKNAVPEEEFVQSLNLKEEEFEMKNDLLEYVQNMGAERNTEVDIKMKPETHAVMANSPTDNLAQYGAETTTNLNSYFEIQQKEACIFTEVPTGTRTQTVAAAAPEVIDRVSKESLYLSKRNDNMVKSQTVENTTWQYDQEKVMNGGELFNGISGYNDMDSGYASVL